MKINYYNFFKVVKINYLLSITIIVKLSCNILNYLFLNRGAILGINNLENVYER